MTPLLFGPQSLNEPGTKARTTGSAAGPVRSGTKRNVTSTDWATASGASRTASRARRTRDMGVVGRKTPATCYGDRRRLGRPEPTPEAAPLRVPRATGI